MASFSKQIDSDIRDLDHTNSSGSWSVSLSPATNLGNPGAVTRNIGLRFTGVTIPQGSTINSAIIRFIDRSTKSVTLAALIQGVDEDNTAEFVLSPENSARTRTKTTASTSWSGSINQTLGNNRDTPSIVSIVQEIVDRASWVSGNAMAFFLSDNGSASNNTLSVEEYDTDTTKAATLIIDYTEPVIGTDVDSERSAKITGVALVYPPGSSGIKLAKDGFTIESTNIGDYNLWTKYPPKTFLEKKTGSTLVDTTDGCPNVGTLTESIPHSYGFCPLVIGRISKNGDDEKYFMPAADFQVSGSFCGVNHALRISSTYRVKNNAVEIDYKVYCGSLVQGTDNECIESNITFNYELDFYMWELGSSWPEP